MPLEKVYTRINWQNQPSTSTALGATNLNKMDYAINEIDDRVVAMDTSKADQDTVNNTVQSITYDDVTGVLTITKVNGTSIEIDTKLEKLAVNFAYDPDTEQLIITLDDGTTQSVDLSALITQYEFLGSDTITFTLDNGKIKADIINGSITDDKLQPNYLADIIVQANIAVANANLSKRYAVGGVEDGDTTDNAKYYAEQAKKARDEAQSIVGADIATDTTPGFVKGGGNVTIGDDGTLNVPSIGELEQLATTEKTNLVAAVNELAENIGTLTELNTDERTNLVEAINEVNESKADKSTKTDVILLASDWTGDTAPYTYTLPVNGVTESSAVEILPQSSLTNAQVDAMINAIIANGIQSNDCITLYAYGDKPNVDLPITIIIRGDM